MDADHHDQRGGEDREEGRHCDDENDPGPFVIPIPWPYDAPRAGLVPPAEELNRESKVWQLEHAASIAFLGVELTRLELVTPCLQRLCGWCRERLLR